MGLGELEGNKQRAGRNPAGVREAGLITYYLLFVMEIGGCTFNPGEAWLMKIASNLTNAED